MITLRGLPLRRPVVVSRKAPHFPGRGGHRPLRLLVIRTNSRCTCQKVTTNHRGGTRALPPAMPAPPLADHLTIALSASGARQDSTLRGSLADHAEEPGEEPVGYGTPRGLVHGAREEQVELRTPEQPGARRSGVTDQLRHLATRRANPWDPEAEAHHPEPVPDRPSGRAQGRHVPRKAEPHPPRRHEIQRGRILEDLTPHQRPEEGDRVVEGAVEVPERRHRLWDVERSVPVPDRGWIPGGVQWLGVAGQPRVSEVERPEQQMLERLVLAPPRDGLDHRDQQQVVRIRVADPVPTLLEWLGREVGPETPDDPHDVVNVRLCRLPSPRAPRDCGPHGGAPRGSRGGPRSGRGGGGG